MTGHKQKLSEADRRAVDLLLNQGSQAAQGGVGTAGPVAEAHVAAAQKWLKLISGMPAMDPPTDLIARTMERIDAAAGRSVQPAATQSTSAAHA